MPPVPKWRVAIAALVVVVLAALASQLIPIYVRNMRLQQFVEETARNEANLNKPADLLRVMVLNRASRLGLPVRSDNVQVTRAPDVLRIDVRYIVRVDLPLYTVDLHFYPGAGSR
jgi:hypothetical protein